MSATTDTGERLAAAIAAALAVAAGENRGASEEAGIQHQGDYVFDYAGDPPARLYRTSVWVIASRQMSLDRNRRVYERSRGRHK